MPAPALARCQEVSVEWKQIDSLEKRRGKKGKRKKNPGPPETASNLKGKQKKEAWLSQWDQRILSQRHLQIPMERLGEKLKRTQDSSRTLILDHLWKPGLKRSPQRKTTVMFTSSTLPYIWQWGPTAGRREGSGCPQKALDPGCRHRVSVIGCLLAPHPAMSISSISRSWKFIEGSSRIHRKYAAISFLSYRKDNIKM